MADYYDTPEEQDDEDRKQALYPPVGGMRSYIPGGAGDPNGDFVDPYRNAAPPVRTAASPNTPAAAESPAPAVATAVPGMSRPRYAEPEPPAISDVPPVTASLPEAAPPVRPKGPAEQRLSSLVEQGAPPVTPLHGWKRALDIVGQIAAPRVEEAIRYEPQHEWERNRAQAQRAFETEQAPEKAAAEREKEQGESGLRTAQTDEAKARAEALRHPPEKQGLTPEETTIHDLMTGENGQARLNPDTGKPYTYLEAYTAVKQAAQDVNPEKTQTEEEQFIGQYLKDNKLPDTAANRLKARAAFSTATRKPEGEAGTWALVEDDQGKTVMFNSKTGETKPAPAGVHAKSELTSTTRTMRESAPQVQKFVARINPLIDQLADSLGPVGSRAREAWAGKIGGPDPQFTKLRTDVGLLTTLLMRMHVGARGGEYIMKHFQDLIDTGKQSPENLKAALNEINLYAQELQQEGKGGGAATEGKGGGAGTQGQGGGNAPKPGDVEGGYRFKGGNPADQKNWEKVKEKAK